MSKKGNVDHFWNIKKVSVLLDEGSSAPPLLVNDFHFLIIELYAVTKY